MKHGLISGKQQRFVDEYLVDSNATQAAIRAGYSKRSASSLGKQLLQNPPVLLAVTKARARLVEHVEVTQEFVVAKLVENLNRCMQAIPVLDKQGQETGEYRYEANAAHRALELLGKHLGMFQGTVHFVFPERPRLRPSHSLISAAPPRPPPP